MKKGRARHAFTKPTEQQVADYCAERGNLVDPSKWFAHYSANGWKVGRNPMVDWKAAVRTWEGRQSEQQRFSPTLAERQNTPNYASPQNLPDLIGAGAKP